MQCLSVECGPLSNPVARASKQGQPCFYHLETVLFPGIVRDNIWFSSIRNDAQRPGHTSRLWTRSSRRIGRGLARA